MAVARLPEVIVGLAPLVATLSVTVVPVSAVIKVPAGMPEGALMRSPTRSPAVSVTVSTVAPLAAVVVIVTPAPMEIELAAAVLAAIALLL